MIKPSLRSIATTMRSAPEVTPAATLQEEAPSYRTAVTRAATRQLSGHFPAEAVKAFRVLAANHDMDVQELLAEAVNMVFERYGAAERIELTSGRRKRI